MTRLATALFIAITALATPLPSLAQQAKLQMSAQQQQWLQQASVNELLAFYADKPKSPNYDAERDHMLYWIGGYQRCTVIRGKTKRSLLEMLVMLQKTDERFGAQLPSFEALTLIAAKARGAHAMELTQEEAEVGDGEVMLQCRNKAQVPIMRWMFSELYRYRAIRARTQAG